MADTIRVNTDLLNKCAADLKQTARGFSDAASLLAGLNTGEEWWTKMGRFESFRLDDEGGNAEMGDAGATVRALTNVMRRYDNRLTTLGNNVSKTAFMFRDLENSLQSKAQGQHQGSEARGVGQGGIGAHVIIPGTSGSGDRYEYEQKWDSVTSKVFREGGSYEEESLELKLSGMYGEKKLKKPRDITPESWKKYTTEEKAPERKKTIFEIGAERTGALSWLHTEGEGSKGILKGDYSVDIAKLEGTAELKGGLYKTALDKDGKETMVLEPGISAKIGGSFSLFAATASGQIGGEYLNLHGSADVKAGSIGAEAESQLGIVDGKVAARVSAKAEAIAFEGSLKGGVNVAGVDVTAKGSLNIGIGAHADIGIHDGKFSCDIGASLGIGASVKFEVDYGKAVQSLADGAMKAVDGTVKAFQGAAKAFFSWL